MVPFAFAEAAPGALRAPRVLRRGGSAHRARRPPCPPSAASSAAGALLPKPAVLPASPRRGSAAAAATAGAAARAATAAAAALLLVLLPASLPGAQADVYLHNPRGSNNRLSEQSSGVANGGRLFDSQNNAAGGYQVCDRCSPVCQDAAGNYNETAEGAMKGQMYYYAGSELYLEWTVQNGCGVHNPDVRCQIILQYMCDADVESPSVRDGTRRGSGNTAGGLQEPPEASEAADAALGQHESLESYLRCHARERNSGLYTADLTVRTDKGATATRQNPEGNDANNRKGLECPEERDYYPYWHPTEWHDIAVITDEPERCGWYQEESQNVKSKHECSDPQYNNEVSCRRGGGRWREKASWGEEPPACAGGLRSRGNHNGNVRGGQPYYHLWKIPETLRGTCVIRIRYNVTTKDLDYGSVARPQGGLDEGSAEADHFFVDAGYNGRDAVLESDERHDFLDMGSQYSLQVQVDTAAYGRTFQDRTHSFRVLPRPAEGRVVNFNVRGRRGNIVQVYPAVEYDFVPPNLEVQEGDYIHFQWCGSDANPLSNEGEGRRGTDRSNLVQVADRGETIPLSMEKHTLFFDSQDDPIDAGGRALAEKFGFLDQATIVECDPSDEDDQSLTNCAQLNGASAYFDGGLVQMKVVGEHHVTSTRNNAFPRRSQKTSIRVCRRWWAWYLILGVLAGLAALLALAGYVGVAIFALKHPGHWLFSKRYRPRILRCLPRHWLQARVQQRRTLVQREREEWMLHSLSTASLSPEDKERMEMAKPPEKRTCWQSCWFAYNRVGGSKKRLTVAVYSGLNVTMFLLGFLVNLNGGFEGHPGLPVAKGGGFMLDLNFAVVVLPTLKSLQTSMRRMGTSREWMPIDDPITFHICVAAFILLGSLIHIAGHCWHIWAVASSPRLQDDPLNLWDLTEADRRSGMSVWEQLISWSYRAAPVTGIVLILLMTPMYITAQPCVRRATNRLTRRLGGFKLFFRMHQLWPWVYLVLLLHGPLFMWVWLLFPAILIAMDRMLLAQLQQLPLRLREVKVLPRDVIGLVFDIPAGFSYQAGQYINLGWRGEWHPFTLTSAPEENCISVHIRAPDALDWCSALRRHLTEVLPELTARANSMDYVPPKPGMVIRYKRHDYASFPGILCEPDLSDGGVAEEGLVQPLSAMTVASSVSSLGYETDSVGITVAAAQGKSYETFASTAADKLPQGTVALQVTGPFGAPAQKVWQFETTMVVGAGIGVTPFASILRSVQLRLQQRERLLRGAAAAAGGPPDAGGEMVVRAQSTLGRIGQSTTSTSTLRGGAAARSGSEKSLERLVCDAISLPRKICFYWIVRGQEEFDWFYDILQAAMDGPAKDIVEVSVYVTGEMELSKVRKLDGAKGQWFGRPNWGRVFKQNKQRFEGRHVGVFLCGSPAIGDELERQSKKHSDPVGSRGGTRFSFFKEHF